MEFNMIQETCKGRTGRWYIHIKRDKNKMGCCLAECPEEKNRIDRYRPVYLKKTLKNKGIQA